MTRRPQKPTTGVQATAIWCEIDGASFLDANYVLAGVAVGSTVWLPAAKYENGDVRALANDVAFPSVEAATAAAEEILNASFEGDVS